MQIQACLEFAQKVDARIPEEFADEFRAIAPTFLDPYCAFMKNLQGPAFTPPMFEHIDLRDKALSTQPSKSGMGGVADHDIIEMTQPSQHISQPGTSAPTKMNLRRFKEGKWKINKVVSNAKMNKIYVDWGWNSSIPILGEGILQNQYELKPVSMVSLAPGRWIDDRIIYGYMV